MLQEAILMVFDIGFLIWSKGRNKSKICAGKKEKLVVLIVLESNVEGRRCGACIHRGGSSEEKVVDSFGHKSTT
jgi:hypothetical protein